MRGTLTIARHELRRAFATPMAWICLGIVQLILGIVFWMLLIEFAAMPEAERLVGLAEFVGGGLFGFASLVFLLVIPLLAMRSFAEERRNGSLALLMAAPLGLPAIVFGKFLGLLGLIGTMLALTVAMPASMRLGTPLDLGVLAASSLGLALMLCSFAAASLFVSSLSSQPVVAALGGVGLLLGLWLMEVAGAGDGALASLAAYLSPLGHFDNFRRGVFSSADLAYYLLLSAGFLSATLWRLDWERRA